MDRSLQMSHRGKEGRTHAELCALVLVGRVDRWSSGPVWRGRRGDANRMGAVSDWRRAPAHPPCNGSAHAYTVAGGHHTTTTTPSRAVRDVVVVSASVTPSQMRSMWLG